MKTSSVGTARASTPVHDARYSAAEIAAAQKLAKSTFLAGKGIQTTKLPKDLTALGRPVQFETPGARNTAMMTAHNLQVYTNGATLYGKDLDTTNAKGTPVAYKLAADPVVRTGLKAATKAQATHILKLLQKVIPNYYASVLDGYVQVRTAQVSATKNPSIFVAKGTVNNNDLSGGAYDYHYKVAVNTASGLIATITPPKQFRETN